MPRDHLLRSTEIPQADSLPNVRRVLAALAAGAVTKEQISEQTEISLRQVEYALKAACILGLLGDDDTSMTPSGQELLATASGTGEERSCLRHAILRCEVVKQVAPELLGPTAPTRDALARRIFRCTAGIGKETASRRAQTLLAWRSQVLEVQLPLFPRGQRPRRPRKRTTPLP